MHDTTPHQKPVLSEAELLRALDELAEIVEIVCSCGGLAHTHAAAPQHTSQD